MKKFLILLFMSGSLTLFAQKHELTGQIKDNKTKESLAFCHVMAYNTKDSLISAGISDDKGFFKLILPTNNYKIVFDFVSYQKDTLAIHLNKDTYIGTIGLQVNENQLNEITVKDYTSKTEIDKESFVVTKSMRINTNTTKTLLAKVNGISYDPINNSIKIDGKSNIIFLVNGMEKNQNYIQNLNPDKIKKIEVTRNPGGRYGLEGFDAIINLILKDDYQGVDIQINPQVIVVTNNDNKGLWTINRLLNSSVSASYTQNKLNIYVDYWGNFLKIYDKVNTSQKFADHEYREDYQPQKDNFIASLYNDFTMGVDYSPYYNTTLSYEGDLSLWPGQHNYITKNYIRSLWMQDKVQSQEETFYQSKENAKSNYHSLYLKHKFNQNTDLNADFHYYNYLSDYTNTLTTENTNFFQKGSNNKKMLKLYVEINHTFNKKLSLNSGIGNNYVIQDNTFTQNSNEQTQTFNYNNLRNSFYNYLTWSINSKLATEIGVSLENSNQKYENQEHNYFIYRPYLNLKYSPSQSLSFKLKYRSWTNYPGIDQTNPFVSRIDNNSVSIGNANLRPDVTHKISLYTDIMGNLVSIEPYFYFSNNLISQTANFSDKGEIQYSFDNVGNYQKKGVILNFTIPFGKSLFMQNSVDFYNSQILYGSNENSFYDWKGSSQLAYMNRQKGLTAVAVYQKSISKGINTFGYSTNNNDFWAVMLQKMFLKNRLSATCIYVLPVNWAVEFKQTKYTQTPVYTETTETDLSLLKNTVIFRLAFNFSKGKTKTIYKDSKNENDNSGKSLF